MKLVAESGAGECDPGNAMDPFPGSTEQAVGSTLGSMQDVIVIAGANRDVGRELVRAASRRGLAVRALVRSPERLGDLQSLCAEICAVQVTDAATWKGVMDGARYVVSALEKTRQKDRVERGRIDVDASGNVFAEAARAGVERTGMLSVMGADPRSEVAMLRMKGEAEVALRATGVSFVSVRPNGFFSDMVDFLDMARRGTVWSIGDPDARFNPIGLRDLANFMIDAVLDGAREDRALPVGGPELLSVRDIAAAAGRALNRRVRVKVVPVRGPKIGVHLSARWRWCVHSTETPGRWVSSSWRLPRWRRAARRGVPTHRAGGP